ncbi:MAG: VOC family protein [Noviherbaspirillum sp.]
MLSKRNVMATVAVRNLEIARQFYENKLGLTQIDTGEPEVAVYNCGNASLMVYVSQYAGTNKATAATWDVGSDVIPIVQDLKAKGIVFEHYDFPDTRLEGDVHVFEKIKVAWFKDPDGNILSIVGQ